MKQIAPMTDEQYAALVKLVDAGIRATGLQAHVEIALAAAALTSISVVPEAEG